MPVKKAYIFATMLEAEEYIKFFGFSELLNRPFKTYLDAQNRVLAISEMGLKNAENCATYMCENFGFAEIVNIGACGALSDKYKVGDVLVLDNAALLSELENAEAERATLASANAPVKDNAQRLKYSQYADVVDMEAAAVQRVCERFGKKFCALKYVSDFSQNCDIAENVKKLRGKVLEKYRLL